MRKKILLILFLFMFLSSSYTFAGVIVVWGGDPVVKDNIPSGNDYIDIAASPTPSSSHCLALKSDGSVVAWGDNTHGQCDVPAGNDFVAIAAGPGHSLALKSDGTIVGWGSPANGVLDNLADEGINRNHGIIQIDGYFISIYSEVQILYFSDALQRGYHAAGGMVNKSQDKIVEFNRGIVNQKTYLPCHSAASFSVFFSHRP